MAGVSNPPGDRVRVIRVFVSSPGDVEAERDALDGVVDEINRTVGERVRARLELWKWENRVVPQIGKAPQDVVDEQLSPHEIYLGILATRWGKGTKQEFDQALDAFKERGAPWIAFYFDDSPVRLKGKEARKDYDRVCDFREGLESEGIVGVYEGVSGTEKSFEKQVREHLTSLLLDHLAAPADAAGASSDSAGGAKRNAVAEKPRVPEAYRAWVKRKCGSVELLGLDIKKGQSIRLNHIYVPVTTNAAEPRKRNVKSPPVAELEFQASGQQAPTLLFDRLSKESLYAPGVPGAGKSVFCRWVAWLVAERFARPADVAAPEGYVEDPTPLVDRLPVLIPLRRFWPDLPARRGAAGLSAKELLDAIGQWLEREAPDGLDGDLLRAHLDAGTALLLFDGVDEVPAAHEASEPRALLIDGLANAIFGWRKAGNRVLVTSRPYGLEPKDVRRLDLPSAPVNELTPEAQSLLIRRWFHVLRGGAEGASTAAAMERHVGEREELTPLVSNPMLLSTMCVIYDQGKRLPADRYELYDRIVEHVLYNRFEHDAKARGLIRTELAVVAYGMHTGEGLGETRSAPEAECTHDEIERIMSVYRDQNPHKHAGLLAVTDARDRLLSETGLLLPSDRDRAAFYHLSIQEFLAATRLLAHREPALAAEFVARAPERAWHNTLSFVFGAYAAKNKNAPEQTVALVQSLLAFVTDDALDLLPVIADAIDTLEGQGVGLGDDARQRFIGWAEKAIEHEIPAAERCAVWRTVGRLGDPRIAPDLRTLDGYVKIEAGTYLVGDKKRKHEIATPFWIARYPVTNGQYELFVEAGGYTERRWWSDEGWRWRETEGAEEHAWRHHGKWNGANQPVVGVSWWEADAFARWAGGRLPDEFEWEAAARGPKGWEYAWGDEWEKGRCNTGETDLGVTSPVGIFKRARTPETELDDLTGNVWEWTGSLYDDDKDARVCRGGSWNFYERNCRAAYRLNFRPGNRSLSLGFRVVRQDSK